MTNDDRELESLSAAVRDRFLAEKRVLSYDEYLRQVLEHPRRHTRDAARYLKSCFDYFGHHIVERSYGKSRRWRVFDLEFQASDGQRRREFLAGQEQAQEAFYRIVSNFVRE
ncbi:MAG: serine protein kinase PrkA, partial [Proteobacteria bacterium]|nr:serine protein kinase PrkA [Pseudomonadota bacterium]